MIKSFRYKGLPLNLDENHEPYVQTHHILD